MQQKALNQQTNLLFDRQFYPLFWVQFLGAFNDNLFKNAMVMLITFKLTDSASDTGLLITLAAGLFILPFFIFSAFAGQIADHYPKSMLIKKIKLAEILIMLMGAMALLNQNLWLLFITLFLMGSQSAFFGPIKYSILPEVLQETALIKGNGLFSGSTFLAILLGTIVGG
ncbi:MAG: MFS transporter, partial [Thiomicrorhabdus sp.]|nr:MFS transporter [Thiomicrorhabdus sp.]